MSAHLIYYSKDKQKMMREVSNRAEYLSLRNSDWQKTNVMAIRGGDESMKSRLMQMNYSCLPNDDGTLKGTTRMSTTVGMDIDHIPAEEMQAVRERILSKKDELGLLMLELSARAAGYHLVFKRKPELMQEENLRWASDLLGVKYDEGAKDITRVFFTTTASNDDLIYLDDALFENEAVETNGQSDSPALQATPQEGEAQSDDKAPEGSSRQVSPSERGAGGSNSQLSTINSQLETPTNRTRFIAKGVMKEKNLKPSDFLNEGGRHTTVKIFLGGVTQLLTKAEANGILSELMPEHWNDENIRQLVEDFYKNYTNPSQRLYKYQEELFTQSQRLFGSNEGIPQSEGDCGSKPAMRVLGEISPDGLIARNDKTVHNGLIAGKDPRSPNWDGNRLTSYDDEEDKDDEELSTVNSQLSIKKLPQGVRDSIEAVGPQLAMPVITAICPAIGALATGVEFDVHGQKRGLNLIAYIAGDFASGKGKIDPVVNAWMGEVKALDKMYQMQEDEWRAKKRAAKNKKEQPEEPKLPVRCLTLNNTVANLAERLANTGGKHAFSFTPEADTVAQKWRSTIGDFSIMLRHSYDGTNYEREARSADAVNVHIEKLLWNVTMCGTPDALYRVVSNYTDGFQSRIAVARTPDNTFAPLEDKPYVLTDVQASRIYQIAHLLPLMKGEVVLPKLEARGRQWLERIRIETMKNDDAVTARQRFRVCVTAQRMTCCLMLCKVCETLIQKHGLTGAEAQLKQFPNLWKEMLLKTQTPQMLENYDIIADTLMENALHFFRDRIENAFCSRDYSGCLNGARTKHGKNDTIFARLDFQFTFEQAMQQSVAIKGADVTRNSVQQMLKNWSKQGLVVQTDGLQYRKC